MERWRKENSINTEQWIDQCEKDFFRRLDDVAEQLCTSNRRLIRLSGPTCSGKTTAAALLTDRFAKFGKQMHLISIDDFYYDKEILHATAIDHESGKVDYDSVKTIDLAALGRFIEDVFTKNQSRCPIFDFKEGRRVGYRMLESGKDDVFVFEGIQAVYPEVTNLIERAGHDSIGVYIAPRRTIEIGGESFAPNEIRLLRRLVRDYNFRGADPDFTFGLWMGVRANEEAHIFPYASDCACQIDSVMPYEIGVLKPYLERILPMVPTDSPNYSKSKAILDKIAKVEPISDQLIPKNSLYREFI